VSVKQTASDQKLAEVTAITASPSYRELLDRLQHRIRESQTRATRVLNTELVMLYWSIGRDILAQQQEKNWGDGVIGQIAEDLRLSTGSKRGFSRRNLFYMRRFARLWPDPEKVQPLAAQIGFSWTDSPTNQTCICGTWRRPYKIIGLAANSNFRSASDYTSDKGRQ
jgi:hypothetical protein